VGYDIFQHFLQQCQSFTSVGFHTCKGCKSYHHPDKLVPNRDKSVLVRKSMINLVGGLAGVCTFRFIEDKQPGIPIMAMSGLLSTKIEC
jgi:hypothetical protein